MSRDMTATVNLEAEASLIGAMLLSRDAVEIGLTMLVAEDFFGRKHPHLFSAIRTLYRAGDPIDPVTVANQCDQDGTAKIVGDGNPQHAKSQIMLIQAATPSSANATGYARLIIEAADRRRLLNLGERLMAAAADPTSDLDQSADDAKTELNDLLRPATSLVHPGYGEWAEQIMTEGGMRYDWVVPQVIEHRDRVMLIAGEGFGKMLDLNTLIPTPDGWTRMGKVQVGDRVFAMDGKPCTVTALHPIDSQPESWRLTLDDGTTHDACSDHQWVTVDYRQRQGIHKPEVRTTREIAETLHARGGHTVNHAIPVAGPLQCDDADLPVPPYTLGAWLGDGTTVVPAITVGVGDADHLRGQVEAEGVECRWIPSADRKPGSRTLSMIGMRPAMRLAGVLGFKRIPDMYLRASVEQRMALLRGLMDTDGSVSLAGAGRGRGKGAAGCELTLTHKPLVDGAVELIASLGVKVAVAESRARLNGRDCGPRWRITFQAPFNPFTLPRKVERWTPLRTRRAQYRYITKAERIEPVPMRCITVDSPDGTFLIHERMVPTHNSFCLRQWALMAAAGVHWFTEKPITPMTAMVVDVENSDRQVIRSTQMMHELAERLCPDYDQSRFTIIPFEELDLNRRSDRLRVEAYLAGHRPDLLVIGPLYKLFSSSSQMSWEENAMRARVVIDSWRARYGCAVLIEHHAPKGSGGKRDLDPLGSSVWLRWPEFGLRMDPEGNAGDAKLGHFRGQREIRAWPRGLMRGKPGQWGWRNVDINAEGEF